MSTLSSSTSTLKGRKRASDEGSTRKTAVKTPEKPTSTLSSSTSTLKGRKHASDDEVSKGDSNGIAEWCYLTPEAVRWFMW
eukprot:1124929-Ditylum_brightwellii.AAC.1